MPDRVVEQVREHALERDRVAVKHDGLVRVELDRRTHGLDRTPRNLHEVDRLARRSRAIADTRNRRSRSLAAEAPRAASSAPAIPDTACLRAQGLKPPADAAQFKPW